MDKIIENPDDIYNNIKFSIEKGVRDRHHGFHTPIFSNINSKGHISSRIVVLRNFNSKLMKINFHSDIRSNKIKELEKNIKTNFLFYDRKIKTQLRIKTESSLHFNDKLSKDAWNITKLASRKCYLSEMAPSSYTNKPTDGLPKNLAGIDPLKDESEKGYKNFVVISSQIKVVEWLYLSSLGHRRLLIKVNSDYNDYQWLIP